MFCVRIKTELGEDIVTVHKQEKQDNVNFRTKLLSYQGNNPGEQDKRSAVFWALLELQDCCDFCLSNDHLLLWSKERIFYGQISIHDSITYSIRIKKSKFQIHDPEEA